MRIGATTKQRIIAIKTESHEISARLATLLARLREHAGTKNISKQLETALRKLEQWQREPHI